MHAVRNILRVIIGLVVLSDFPPGVNSILMDNTNRFLFAQDILRSEQLSAFYLERDDDDSVDMDKQLPLHFKKHHSFLKCRQPPVRMLKDKEGLLEERRKMQRQLKSLLARKNSLKIRYSQSLNEQRQLKQIVVKLQSVLPSAGINVQQYHQERKKVIKDEKQALKELTALKKSHGCMKMIEMKVLQEELLNNIERQRKELEKLQKFHKRLIKQSDFSRQQSAIYQQLTNKIAFALQQFKLKQKITEEEHVELERRVAGNMASIQITKMTKEIEQLKKEYDELQFSVQGLEYECVTISRYRLQIPQFEKKVAEVNSLLAEKQQSVEYLKRTLEDKANTHQYMKKWTDELRIRLEDKKRNEALAKEKLEIKINMLNKQFEEWNSKYKTLMMDEQQTRNIKKHKQSAMMEKHVVRKGRIPPVKFYEVEGMCKKIAYELTIQGVSIETFLNNILKQDQSMSFQMLYERLKSTDYISHEGDLLRLVRYVMEDGKTPLPINHYFLMRDSVYTILEKAIGRVLTKEEYDTGLNEAKSTLSVHSDIIKHEFQTRRIENFDMDTLSNILAFLEICLSSRQLLCLCISLYERHKEIDNYSVNAFKNILI